MVTTAGCADGSISRSHGAKLAADRNLHAAEVHRGVVFAERATGPLSLDLFLPNRADKPRPLVVYVHGGGWEAGERQIDGDAASTGSPAALVAERLVRHGYAVATVDYRLSGLARVQDQVLDVGDAVRWLQERSTRWDLDKDRVMLWGGSAGGHLVSQLGVVSGDAQKVGGALTGVRGVVNWFGPSDMSADAQVGHPELGEYSRRAVAKALGCLPVQCPAHAEQASPAKNVSGDEPAFLIQHGTADQIVPIDQSLDFAEELRRHDVEVQMHPYEGVGHGFGHIPQTRQIVDTMVAFVDAHLSV